MELGETRRVWVVEPLEEPFEAAAEEERRAEAEEPEPEPEPERVPAGA
jgi:hypothetical protein